MGFWKGEIMPVFIGQHILRYLSVPQWKTNRCRLIDRCEINRLEPKVIHSYYFFYPSNTYLKRKMSSSTLDSFFKLFSCQIFRQSSHIFIKITLWYHVMFKKNNNIFMLHISVSVATHLLVLRFSCSVIFIRFFINTL